MGSSEIDPIKVRSAKRSKKSAYVYYISPTQINILTPPDTISGSVQVVVTNNGAASATFTAQAQAISPSLCSTART